MRRITMAGGLALAASAFALIAAPVAGATTYNNDAPIIIPAGEPANPYPSSITVSGTAGPITDVNVGFDGLTDSFSAGVAISLVAPTGQALMLAGCAGTSASAAFITLDDGAGARLPDDEPLTTGTYKPAEYCPAVFSVPGPMSYQNPGPFAGGTATFASAFNGLSAIGTWNLYVTSLTSPDTGAIPGGWSLDVNPDVTPLPPAKPAPTPAPAKKCKKKGKKFAATAAKKKSCKKKKKK
jgi:hypothetical protein